MGKNVSCKVIFEDGSQRDITIPLSREVARIVAVTRADHDLLHQSRGRRKADFRLGQLDLKAAAVDLLKAAAADAVDETRWGLIRAAELIKEMEVPHEDS